MTATRAEAERQLTEHTRQVAPGRYTFDGGATHSREAAIDTIEACLLLGVNVTDTISTRAWLTVARRIAELESALAKLKEPT